MRSPMRSLVRAAVVGLSTAMLVSPAAALAAPTAHHAAKKKHHKKKHHKKSRRGRRGARGPRGFPGTNGTNGNNGAPGTTGPQGPAGSSGALHYRTVIAAAQPGTGTKQPQGTPTALLTFGPFALVGYCYRTTDTSTTPPTVMTNSDTYVVTSQNGSSFASRDFLTAAGNFNAGLGGEQPVNQTAATDPIGQDYSPGGSYSLSSADGQHAYHGESANGVRLRGAGSTAARPDCSFSGYVIDES